MSERFIRTKMVLGEEAVDNLKNVRVAVFGIGGVGGYVCEALARSGVGAFDLIDDDTVCLSNLNRQIIATESTVGMPKVDVMKERILSINPEAEIVTHQCFFLPENADEFHFEDYDYIVDAIDTVTAKIAIILKAQAVGTPIICAMGTGNKVDITKLRVTDIYKTEMDPLAKVMRKELKKRNVKHLKVVYSEEKPVKPQLGPEQRQPEEGEDVIVHKRRSTPGSTAFVPGAAGLLIASEVVQDLIRINQNRNN